jgi:hypothetical protein
LDWGTAFGPAFQTGYGATTTNPYNTSSVPWSANLPDTDSVNVSLGLGGTTLPGGFVVPSGSTTYLVREDNTDVTWNGSAWTTVPGHLDSYPGNFGGPTQVINNYGDNLLGPSQSNGSPTSAPMVITFGEELSIIEFQISALSNGTAATNFNAELDAYNCTSFTNGLCTGIQTLVGTFYISATGAGGACTSLESFSNPVSCNTAPYIGYENLASSFNMIVVDAIDTGGVTGDLSGGNYGFLIDRLGLTPTLDLSAIPEPAAIYLLMGGLAVLTGLSKRSGRRGC